MTSVGRLLLEVLDGMGWGVVIRKDENRRGNGHVGIGRDNARYKLLLSADGRLGPIEGNRSPHLTPQGRERTGLLEISAQTLSKKK